MNLKPASSLPVSCLSSILAAMIIVTSGPIPLAAQTPVLSVGIQPTAGSERSDDQGTLPARVDRSVTDVAPPNPTLTFSQDPSDEEISEARVFSEPLTRACWKSNLDENRALAASLLAFSKRSESDDFSIIEKFIADYPASPWRISLLVNLGLAYKKTGYLSQAMRSWEDAWTEGKTEPEPRMYDLASRALGELALMNAQIGMADRVKELIEEVKSREIHGFTTELITAAAEGLWIMNNRPDEALRCGPHAVQKICQEEKNGNAFGEEIKKAKSTSKGTNLLQVRELANRVGIKYQMAKRAPGAVVVVPSIAHLKVGHFSAVTKEIDGKYVISDPAFGEDILATQKAIESETSSYFLIPAGPLPDGWLPVNDLEGRHIWGKCSTSATDNKNTKRCDEQAGGNCGCNGAKAMARYNFHLAVASLHIQDTPLFYKPSRGPSINFELNYSQRDPRSDTILNYANFGQKWTYDWHSFITDNPTSIGADVKIYSRGGGIEAYTGYNSTTKTYSPEIYSQAKLVLTSSNPISYEKRYSDGSKELYDIPTGVVSGARKIFLHKIIDAAGDALTLTYDPYFKIVAITDALGQTTRIYSGADGKISKIKDPFGRSASFEYNIKGQLACIRDMIGLESRFEYGTGLKADFITKLITPYGATSFDYGDASTDSSLGRTRWVEITDPNGSKERIEYSETVHPDDASVPPTLVPSDILTYNGWLQARNTFYWGKKAMDVIASGALDYSKAHVYHWLHSSPTESGGILESEKEPDSNFDASNPVTNHRVWYNYQGQTAAYNQGTSNLRTRIARVIGGSATQSGTTQLVQREYNSLGHITKEVDPAGRTTIFEYESASESPGKDIDLLNVYQVVNGVQQLLKSYRNYNSRRLPQIITDAAGQSTTYSYTATGNVETITRRRNGADEVTRYTYITDASMPGYGKIQTITGPSAGATVTFTYDPLGRVRTVTGPDGYSVAYSYDALDRITKVQYPDQTFVQTIYNRLDPEWTRDRLGRWTHRVFDALQHVTDVIDPMGRNTHFDYCGCGALEEIVDPNGNHTTFIVDVQSRVTSKTFSDGKTVLFGYDPTINRLQTVTDAKNQVAHYEYFLDGNLREVSYTKPDGTSLDIPTPTVAYTYDPAYNRIVTMQDGIGTTTYEYHPITAPLPFGAGRLKNISGPLANSTVTFGYDEYGRVRSQALAGGTSSVVFDALGRVASETNPLCTGTNTFSYDYDGATGRLRHAYYPDGQVEERIYFDNVGDNRLRQIRNLPPSAGTVLSEFNHTYNGVGNILTWEQANSGATGSKRYGFEYDGADQLTGADLKDVATGTSIKQHGYVYDPAGNRVSKSEAVARTVTGGTFNGLNQLKGLSGAAQVVLTGSVNKPSLVDVNENPVQIFANKFTTVVSVTTGTNDITIKATDANHPDKSTTKKARIIVNETTPSQAFEYDDNGNLTSDGIRTFTWDARNRLISISYADSSKTEFAYDGLDRRVSVIEKDAGGVVTSTKKLLWVGNEIRQERDASNAVTKSYFTRGMQKNGVSYFYTRDHLGSIREVTDSNGVALTRYDYDPYGRQTVTRLSGTTSVDADFGFTGHYYHEPSALNLTLYRAYDADTARWLSRDPIGEDGGINLYRYCLNNPVSYVDPDGKNPILAAVAVVATGYAIYQAYKAFDAARKATEKAFKEGERRRKCQNGFDVNNPDTSGLGVDMDAYNSMANDIGTAVENIPGTSLTGPAENPGPSTSAPFKNSGPSQKNPTFSPPWYGRSAY